MSNFDLKIDNNKNLLLAWLLLRESKNALRIENPKYGEGFFRFYRLRYENYELISESFFLDQMNKFLIFGAVSELYIEVIKDANISDENGPFYSEKTYYFISDEVKKSDQGHIHGLLTSEELKDAVRIYYYKINEEKIMAYIKEYLNKWQNNKFILPNQNILKAEKQLKLCSEHIYALLEDFPSETLLINNSLNDNRLDFFTCMIFLESIGDIEIIQNIEKIQNQLIIYDVNYKLTLRITIMDKFYMDFKKLTLDFEVDFEYLETGKHKNELPILKDDFLVTEKTTRVTVSEISEDKDNQYLRILDLRLNRKTGVFTRQNGTKERQGKLTRRQIELILIIEKFTPENTGFIFENKLMKALNYGNKTKAAFATLLSKTKAALQDKDGSIIHIENNYEINEREFRLGA